MQLQRRLFIAAVVVLLLCGPLGVAVSRGDDVTGTLIVDVLGLASNEGNLRFVLFDSDKDFLKRPIRAEVLDIEDQKGRWIVKGLTYGTYAVLVHHDIDADGTMDRHWYGKPKEPTGASSSYGMMSPTGRIQPVIN